MLHSYHTERPKPPECCVMRPTRKATSGCENGPPPPYPPPLAGEGRVGEGRVRSRWNASACAESVGASVRASYDPLDPLDPLELEPWSGGAELGVDAAGLELGDGAGTGDAGFGAMWLAGAAGAAGRGAIGDAPTCVGDGDAGPEAGGVAETGRGAAGGGANGFGAGGGTKGFGAGAAATGFGGGGGAAGRCAGAGAAAIGFGCGATGFGAGIAAAGCLGAVF
jgi:hypothetical protein